jgi:hypothetical protein
LRGEKLIQAKHLPHGLHGLLSAAGWEIAGVVEGGPPELGKGLRLAFDQNQSLDILACEQSFVKLAVLQNFRKL